MRSTVCLGLPLILSLAILPSSSLAAIKATLKITENQETIIRKIMNLPINIIYKIIVTDTDFNGQLNAGDVATATNSKDNTDTKQHTLTAKDIYIINKI